MIKVDRDKVKAILKRKGDDFWREEGNVNLFSEIVLILNNEGYDLKLIKKYRNNL